MLFILIFRVGAASLSIADADFHVMLLRHAMPPFMMASLSSFWYFLRCHWCRHFLLRWLISAFSSRHITLLRPPFLSSFLHYWFADDTLIFSHYAIRLHTHFIDIDIILMILLIHIITPSSLLYFLFTTCFDDIFYYAIIFYCHYARLLAIITLITMMRRCHWLFADADFLEITGCHFLLADITIYWLLDIGYITLIYHHRLLSYHLSPFIAEYLLSITLSDYIIRFHYLRHYAIDIIAFTW